MLRCFDKDATEELYLINLLTFDSPEVDKWKGMVACWKLALVNMFDLEELVACCNMICPLITITVRLA